MIALAFAVHVDAQSQAPGSGIAFVDQLPLTLTTASSVARVELFNGGRKRVHVTVVATGDDVFSRLSIRGGTQSIDVGETTTVLVVLRQAPPDIIVRGQLVALSSDGSLARRAIDLQPADYVATRALVITAHRDFAPSFVDTTGIIIRSQPVFGSLMGVLGSVRSGTAVGSVRGAGSFVEVIGLSRPGEYHGSFSLEPDGTGPAITLTVFISDAWWWTAAALGIGVMMAWGFEALRRRRVPLALQPIDSEAARLREAGNAAIASVRPRDTEPPLRPLYAYAKPRRARDRVLSQLRATAPGTEPAVDLSALGGYVKGYEGLVNEIVKVSRRIGSLRVEGVERSVTGDGKPVGAAFALDQAVRLGDDVDGTKVRVRELEQLVTAVAELDGFYREVEKSRGQPEPKREQMLEQVTDRSSLRDWVQKTEERASALQRDASFKTAQLALWTAPGLDDTSCLV